MIVFELECRPSGHRFEGWFASSDDFSRQCGRGLVACPECETTDIVKAPMSPRLARKGNQCGEPVAAQATPAASPQAISVPPDMPPQVLALMRAAAAAQAEALKSSRWVGDRFADDARAMHYGEKDHAVIHGKATPEEARGLMEEGIEVAPLLFPVADPGKVN